MLYINDATNITFSFLIPFMYSSFLVILCLYSYGMTLSNAFTELSAVTFMIRVLLVFGGSILIFFCTFTGRENSIWFGHFFFSLFIWKITLMIVCLFFVIICAITVLFPASRREYCDFLLVLINLFLWICFLFIANTLIAIFFIIEIITTLLMLLLIVTSDNYFTDTALRTRGVRKSRNTFVTAFSSIFIFFWTSLLMSLFLFLTLLFCWKTFMTTDLFFIELIFYYDLFPRYYYFIIIFLLFFSFFFKCGVVPFFFWKPFFFRYLPLVSIFVYVVLFYFILLIFFFYLTINFFFFFLQPFAFCFSLLLLVGFLFLFFILCESFYLKTFIALSSILNTILLFFPLTNGLLIFVF